jgi:hypothetical protein
MKNYKILGYDIDTFTTERGVTCSPRRHYVIINVLAENNAIAIEKAKIIVSKTNYEILQEENEDNNIEKPSIFSKFKQLFYKKQNLNDRLFQKVISKIKPLISSMPPLCAEEIKLGEQFEDKQNTLIYEIPIINKTNSVFLGYIYLTMEDLQ